MFYDQSQHANVTFLGQKTVDTTNILLGHNCVETFITSLDQKSAETLQGQNCLRTKGRVKKT